MPENEPGKYVRLLKEQNEEVAEEENPEASTIRSVSYQTSISRANLIYALFSLQTWNQVGVLSDEILKSLVEMKFSSPTEIQRVSIPVSVYGKCDILGAAPTGSGKTLGEFLQKLHLLDTQIFGFSIWHSYCPKHSKNIE